MLIFSTRSIILTTYLILLTFSRFNIISPPELKEYFNQKYGNDSKGIPYSIANFGDVPYGRTLTGQIETPTVLENCIFEDIPNYNKTKKIILSERNDCKFTQKALNTQKQGGIMSIIMDNEIQNPGKIIMIDDGHGSRIHIPTVLISKLDGQKILETMTSKNVSISISFQTNKTDKASLNLFLDISDRSNIVFLRKFQPYFNKIKENMNMDINYATIPCSTCRQGECFYNGTYCKRIIYGWIQDAGQIFIKQQLRQYFIYQEYQNLWWIYMDQFDQHCSETTQQPQLQDCSINTMEGLKIDSNKILKLVNESFKEDTNPILEKSSIARENSQVLYYPTIVVNNVTYRGNLEPFEVEQMICKSLKNPPESCFSNESSNKQSHLILYIFLSILGFLVLLVFIIFCYRRIIRRKITNNMNKQVNELVNQYITMYEAQKFKGDQQLIEKENQTNN